MGNIKIISDSNELKFVEKKLVNKAPMLVYEYVVSESKLGQTLVLSESDLDKMIKKNIAVYL